MNNLTLRRYTVQLQGTGAEEDIDDIEAKGLLTEIVIANDHGVYQHEAKLFLNGGTLLVALINGSTTFVQDLAVPIKKDDALTFEASVHVYFTLVFTVPG